MLPPETHMTCVILLIIYALQFLAAHVEVQPNAKMLLLSFDGFRWDYLQRVGRHRTPNFHYLIDTGVHPQYVENAFLTKTFPSHLTIATGLYEETHGVVDNDMFDPELNEIFSHTPKQMGESKWWDSGVGALPIWTANELGRNNKRSGVIYWPSSLVQFANMLPYQSLGQWNSSKPFEDLIDIMIEWFTDEHHPINFGAIYFNQPDELGHDVGPNDPKIDDLIATIDQQLIGRLLKKINQSEDLASEINLVITSDHGMAEVSNKRVLTIDLYVNSGLYTAYGSSPVWNILAKPGKIEEVYNKLKGIPHLNVWLKKDIPPEYHYSNNRRILDILMVADIGWMFQQSAQDPKPLPDKEAYGKHGFKKTEAAMHPFFIASGPAFKSKYVRPPINVVDIYPLLCHVLNVPMGTTNGSLDNVRDMLVIKPAEGMTTTFVTFIVVVIGVSLVAGVFTIAAVCQQRRHRTVVRRIRLLDRHDGAHLSTDNGLDAKPMLGPSDDELDL